MFGLEAEGVTLRDALGLVERFVGDRYRGLNGWNFEEVTRVTPPGENGEPGVALRVCLK